MDKWTSASTAALVFAFLAGSAAAQVTQTDEQVSQALPGSWIIPPDTSDRADQAFLAAGNFAIERFDSDRTGVVTLYHGPGCTNQFYQNTFTWTVRDGVFIFTYADGHRSNARIQNITNDSFTFDLPPDRHVIRARGSCDQPAATPSGK